MIIGSALSSCRKSDPVIINPQDQISFESWSDVFESYWNGMNYSYSFWDVDPTDWDKVYNDYKPRFEGLEFGSSEDSLTVKKMFGEITENIIDHHYALILFKPDKTIWAGFSPGHSEIKKRDYYHEAFTEEDVVSAINANITKGRLTDIKAATAENGQLYVYSYCIDNSIAYFRLNAFSISQNLDNAAIKETIDNFYSIINDIENLKGIIIDTRGNGGGALADMYFVLCPLITEELTFGYTRSKNGMGRLDYTPWSPMILYPIEEDNPVTRDIKNVPIVSLIDINSTSMGEFTPMAISEMANGYVIGERSAGGHGPLDNDFDNYYAGAFKNTAFEVYTSTSMTKRLDGKIYEGIGIIPDKEVLFDESDFKKGNDRQLESAVQYINSLK